MHCSSLYCTSCGTAFEVFGPAEELGNACCPNCAGMTVELATEVESFPEEDGFDIHLRTTVTGRYE